MKVILYFVRIVLVVAFLAIGVAGYMVFSSMAKPPSTEEPEETVVRAKARRLQPEDTHVILTGLGTLRAKQRRTLSAEVGGRIVEVHPRLEAGNLIPKGEVLIRIDPRDYQLMVRQASAEVERLAAEISQIALEDKNSRQQLEIARGSLALAEKEFKRFRDLAGEGARSESAKERAQLEYNQAQQTVLQLDSALSLYPVRLRKTRAMLASAREVLAKAELNLEKSTITAPFNARVADKRIEVEQFVAPGTPLFTLVDDSVLEIVVPLDGPEVKRWLLEGDGSEPGWFDDLPERAVEITWAQDETIHATGQLVRVEDYDPTTRTVKLACRLPQTGGLLSEGMFCRVAIPGKTVQGVYRLPRRAVTHEGDVILVLDGRMKTVRVEPIYEQGEDVLVSGPLSPGDIAILEPPTRIIEGQRVEPAFEREEETEAAP